MIAIPLLAFLAPHGFGRRRGLGVFITLAGLTGGPIRLALGVALSYVF